MRATKLFVAAAVVLLGSAVGGRAFAAWRANGVGHGTANVGSMTIVVNATAQADNSGRSVTPNRRGDVIVSVTNDNAFAVRVVSVASSGAPVAVDHEHDAAGCARTNLSVLPVVLAEPITLQPSERKSFAVPGAIAMSEAAPSSCQGATFLVPIQVTVKR